MLPWEVVSTWAEDTYETVEQKAHNLTGRLAGMLVLIGLPEGSVVEQLPWSKGELLQLGGEQFVVEAIGKTTAGVVFAIGRNLATGMRMLWIKALARLREVALKIFTLGSELVDRAENTIGKGIAYATTATKEALDWAKRSRASILTVAVVVFVGYLLVKGVGGYSRKWSTLDRLI